MTPNFTFRTLDTRFLGGLLALVACTVPNPNYRPPPHDASPDGTPVVKCAASSALRCTGEQLVHCNSDGNAEILESCPLGCDAAKLRCVDVNPSNALATYLDQAAVQADINLGDSAIIDTDTGEIADGRVSFTTMNGTLVQSGAPAIRVVVVRSFTAKDVVVRGKNALAIVSSSDIKIDGVFTVSAKSNVPGAGAPLEGLCLSTEAPSGFATNTARGRGGGGFGSRGGFGGTVRNSFGTQLGDPGGDVSGDPSLVPLRGGCFSTGTNFRPRGAGGGAIQLVSRTRVVVNGVVAANGGGCVGGGGGSGGGILLEAPIVDVSGKVVANGGSGSGCGSEGQDGRLDAAPAAGGANACSDQASQGFGGAGGNGGAGTALAENGSGVVTSSDGLVTGGSGGGGVGRIRVNTAPGGLRGNGIISPPATIGTLVSR